MTPPNAIDALRSQSKWLRKAAEEIRIAGHNGWGNTCEQAADEIDRVAQHALASEAALREALSNLLKACQEADLHEELSEFVDGSLLDAAKDALASPSGQPAPFSVTVTSPGYPSMAATGQPAPHEHKWRTIYGDPATGKPQIEACDICNQERAEYWQPALAALKAEVRRLILDDSFAGVCQTTAQYRNALLDTIDLVAPPAVTRAGEKK